MDDVTKDQADIHALGGAELGVVLHLQKVSTLLTKEGDVGALYEQVLDAAVHVMSADFGSFQVYSLERNELSLLANRGFHPVSAEVWRSVTLGSTTACSIAMASGARTVIPDIEAPEAKIRAIDLEAYRKSGIRAVQSTPIISRFGQPLGMISTHWREPYRPPEDAFRSFDVLARQAANLLERAHIDSALRASQERYRWLASIVESSDDAIISTDLDGLITSWNKGAERIYGYTPEQAVGRPVTIIVPADRQNEEPSILERIRRGEQIDHYETVRLRNDGSLVQISLTVSPVRNLKDQIVGASKIARDISDRKKADDLVATLAREAEHRTKNVLSTVLATIHLSKADTSDELKSAIEGRIRALADVHALFVKSRWTGADIHNLVTQELAPYCLDGDGRALIEGPHFVVKTASAQAIAITLHELATNAAKYGALSVAKGSVRVEWSQMLDGRLMLRWLEANGPTVATPARQGFGTRVMKNIINSQGGTIEFSWNPQGLLCELSMPA